jgi:hypothetical protein
MNIKEFQKKIELIRKKSVHVHINNNHTTLLNFIPKHNAPDFFSMHKIFLNADANVEKALTLYISGSKIKSINTTLRTFMHTQLQNVDYSKKVKNTQLDYQGKIFNLHTLYHSVHQRYFPSFPDLKITWFGQQKKLKRYSQRTLGQYNDLLKLIKIHRCLDNKKCPKYFISFVIYHEILHAVYPPYLDKGNRYRYHDKIFRQKEREFSEYHQAKDWEKTYQWQLC